MSAPRRGLAAFLGLALGAASVVAGAAPHSAGHEAELRANVLASLSAQEQAVAAARAVVEEKRSAAVALRDKRARAAARTLRAGADTKPLELARRKAAAAWLLAREQGEVALLVEESAHLGAAQARLGGALAKARTAPLPPRDLRWPAKGKVARGFGRLVHERSGATLARRGVDLEVESGARAAAMAPGTVVYAGPIRGLDQGVLVDHGDYLTLVAKLKEPVVRTGDRVEAETPLGRAARRRVYLELRLALLPAGLPIDPLPFLRDAE